MYKALTEHFTLVHPLILSPNPFPFMTGIVNREKEGNRKAGSERGVQWERKQTKSHRRWDKFLRINEQAEAVEVKRKSRRSRKKL